MAAEGRGRLAVSIVLRVLVAAGLVVDAVVHLRLAAGYQLAAPGGIGEGTLFRIEAGVAIAVAAWVLVRGSRPAAAVAFLVAAAALGAVLVYRYVDVPGFGPLPAMYEPVWFFQKSLSAVGEAVTVVAALALLLVGRGVPQGPGAHRGERPVGAAAGTGIDR
jgi:hypothetical protein